MDDEKGNNPNPWLAYLKHRDEISPEDQELAIELAEKLKTFWETSATLAPEQVIQEKSKAIEVLKQINQLGFEVDIKILVLIPKDKSKPIEIIADVELFTATYKTGALKPN